MLFRNFIYFLGYNRNYIIQKIRIKILKGEIIIKYILLYLGQNGNREYKLGILIMLVSIIWFVLTSVIVKFLSDLPLMEVIFFRSLPTMLVIPIILKNKKISFWGNNHFFLLFRCLLSTCNMAAYYYTIRVMTLADAVTIKQLSPFFIIILAKIFLKEKIISKQIYTFIFAFIGAILIIKPGLRLDIFPAIIGILGAMATAGSHVIVRHLRLTEHPLVIVNYFGFTTGLVALVIILWQGNFCIPNTVSLYILVLLGLTGLGGQVSITKAYQMVKVSTASFYLYLQIIFSVILGIIFFREVPDLFSVLGASVIIMSGYLNYKLNLKLSKKREIEILE